MGGGVDETPAVTEPSGATSPTGSGTGSAGASASGTAAPTGTGRKKLDPPKPAPTAGGGGGGGGAHKILVSLFRFRSAIRALNLDSLFIRVFGRTGVRSRIQLCSVFRALTPACCSWAICRRNRVLIVHSRSLVILVLTSLRLIPTVSDLQLMWTGS